MGTLSKTFDPSKFTKSITKSISGISTGFNDPDTWVQTGNYALNKRISGDFNKGIPLGKLTMFAGESGCLPKSAKVTIRLVPEIEKTVTIEELKELYHSNEYDIEIDTPDGFQAITKWFNKGIMDMVKIDTPNHSSVCAENHMVQLDNDMWVLAYELDEGTIIKTISGNEPVLTISPMPPEECFDFTVDHENQRYYGDGIVSHNQGKSFLASGQIVKHAQEQGIFCVIIDSENALDEKWLKDVGVDTSPDKLMRIQATMIDDVAKIITDFVSAYKTDYMDIPKEERPKVLFVIDSIGMLLTPTEVSQFESGDMKGDMGRKAKQLKALVINCTNMIGNLNIGIVMTNHSYSSQDMFSPEDIVSGGSGPIYASQIVVAMKKLKLKMDEYGNKVKDVRGIRAACQLNKTRYAKPFEKIELVIPWETGLDPYSGLLDMFEKEELVVKDGNKLKYISKDGTEYKEFRKNFGKDILTIIMNEYDDVIEEKEKVEDEIIEDDQDQE